MKKFLIAVATCLLILVGQAEASTVGNLDAQVEAQDMSKWSHFRDKHIFGHEKENERRDRKEWERWQRERHRYAPPPRHIYEPPPRHGHYPPPPPPSRRW